MQRLLVLIFLNLLVITGFAAEPAGDQSTAKLSYSVGFQVGSDFRLQGAEIDPDAVARGLRDAMAGKPPAVSEAEMEASLRAFKREMVARQQQERKRKSDEFRAEGRDYLQENAKRPEVTALPSGLQYEILRPAEGMKPGLRDTVKVHYRGRLLDGTEFDSSYRQGGPAAFRVDGVIPGWTEALQLMKTGEKWRLFIPPELAYGQRGPLADRTLVFDVELLAIESQATPDQP